MKNNWKKIIFFYKDFFIFYPPAKESGYILAAILLCAYMFYIRILLKRADDLIQYRGNLFLIFLYIILVIIFLLKIKHHFFPNKVVKNIVIAYLTEKVLSLLKVVVEFYKKMFFELYVLLVDRHKYHNETLNFLHKQLRKIYFFIDNYILTEKQPFILYYLYYVFVLFPYFIFALSLLLDVIVCKKFFFLLYLWWVLILPLVWNTVFYFLKIFCDREWEIYCKYFTIEKTYKINKNKTITASVSSMFNYDAEIVNEFPLTEEEYYFIEDTIEKWSVVRDIFFDFYTNPEHSPLFDMPLYKRLIMLTASLNLVTFSYRLYNEIIFYPSW